MTPDLLVSIASLIVSIIMLLYFIFTTTKMRKNTLLSIDTILRAYERTCE